MLRRTFLRLSEKDPWGVLGVAKSASEKEVKSAYLKLAKKHHPDLNGGKDEMFKKVKLAYEKISSGDADRERKQREDNVRGQAAGGAGRSSRYGAPGHSGASGRAARAQTGYNPFDSGYRPGSAQEGNKYKAWSQRAEYYRLHEEEADLRAKAAGELQRLARVIGLVALVFILLPSLAMVFVTNDDERQRRQEEFERLRRQQMQLNAMRSQYDDPSRPPKAVGTGQSEGFGWVWVHPYGWQWLPLDKLKGGGGGGGMPSAPPPPQVGRRPHSQPPPYAEEERPHHPSDRASA